MKSFDEFVVGKVYKLQKSDGYITIFEVKEILPNSRLRVHRLFYNRTPKPANTDIIWAANPELYRLWTPILINEQFNKFLTT